MTFRAKIERADGTTRVVEFVSIYDARAALAMVVEKDHLAEGEKLALVERIA